MWTFPRAGVTSVSIFSLKGQRFGRFGLMLCLGIAVGEYIIARRTSAYHVSTRPTSLHVFGGTGIMRQSIVVYYCYGRCQWLCTAWCAMGHAVCRWSDPSGYLTGQAWREILESKGLKVNAEKNRDYGMCKDSRVSADNWQKREGSEASGELQISVFSNSCPGRKWGGH